jgi:hypothetical protein
MKGTRLEDKNTRSNILTIHFPQFAKINGFLQPKLFQVKFSLEAKKPKMDEIDIFVHSLVGYFSKFHLTTKLTSCSNFLNGQHQHV